MEPPAPKVAVPLVGINVMETEAGFKVPSESVSFASTGILTNVLGLVTTSLRFAIGATFARAFTVITTKAVSQSAGTPLSQTR